MKPFDYLPSPYYAIQTSSIDLLSISELILNGGEISHLDGASIQRDLTGNSGKKSRLL